MYIRQNATQEFLADLCQVSQPTVSRIVSTIVPIVKAVLEEFVPDAKEAIMMVKGRACLVDGTITPCWSYADHPELWSRKKGITGFNAQLVSLLDGTPVFVSDPLPGKNHDKTAFDDTLVAEIVSNSGGGIGDKGYQGTTLATPRKKPRGGELSKRDKENNKVISALRAPIEQVVAHFKNWKILPGRRRGSHPPPPTDPDVSLSAHPARAVQFQVVYRIVQWANRSGARCRTPASHAFARWSLRLSRLYFHLAQRTRWRSMRRHSGITALG
jgi:hypothetical protein